MNKGHTLESDFNRLVFAYMRYFPLDLEELFLPEVWGGDQSNGRLRCDGLFGTVNTDINDVNYGKLIAKMMFEGKNYTAISWSTFMRIQMWNQCDTFKNVSGRLWAVGLIGFEICFFKFDVTTNMARGDYTNFSPLILDYFVQRGWTKMDFEYIGVKCITYPRPDSNNLNDIVVMKWMFNDFQHQKFIHMMFVEILRNEP